jgi:hypothetical protein
MKMKSKLFTTALLAITLMMITTNAFALGRKDAPKGEGRPAQAGRQPRVRTSARAATGPREITVDILKDNNGNWDSGQGPISYSVNGGAEQTLFSGGATPAKTTFTANIGDTVQVNWAGGNWAFEGQVFAYYSDTPASGISDTGKTLGVIAAGKAVNGDNTVTIFTVTAPGTPNVVVQAGNWQNGIYRIQAQNGVYLQIADADKNGGAALVTGNQSGGDNAQFRVEMHDNKNYTLTAVHSGMLLDVNGDSRDDGAAIIQWNPTGGFNQQWKLAVTNDGYYQIVSASSEKNITIPGNASGNNVAIVQQGDNGSAGQKFRFVFVSALTEVPKLEYKPAGPTRDVTIRFINTWGATDKSKKWSVSLSVNDGEMIPIYTGDTTSTPENLTFPAALGDRIRVIWTPGDREYYQDMLIYYSDTPASGSNDTGKLIGYYNGKTLEHHTSIHFLVTAQGTPITKAAVSSVPVPLPALKTPLTVELTPLPQSEFRFLPVSADTRTRPPTHPQYSDGNMYIKLEVNRNAQLLKIDMASGRHEVLYEGAFFFPFYRSGAVYFSRTNRWQETEFCRLDIAAKTIAVQFTYERNPVSLAVVGNKVFTHQGISSQLELWVRNLDGSGLQKVSVPNKSSFPPIEYNGKLYVANGVGTAEFYEMNMDGTGARKISARHTHNPLTGDFNIQCIANGYIYYDSRDISTGSNHSQEPGHEALFRIKLDGTDWKMFPLGWTIGVERYGGGSDGLNVYTQRISNDTYNPDHLFNGIGVVNRNGTLERFIETKIEPDWEYHYNGYWFSNYLYIDWNNNAAQYGGGTILSMHEQKAWKITVR